MLGIAASIVACSPPPPSATQLVASAIARTATVQSAHFKLEVTKGYILVGSLQVLQAEGDVARPDRLRVRARAQLGGVIVETNIVHVDGTSFLQDPFTLRWQRLTTSLLPVPLLDPERGVVRLIAAIGDPRVEGRESVDGAAGWRVSGHVHPSDVTALLGGSPAGPDVRVEAVVGDDGAVRRLVLTGAVVVGELADMTRRIEFSGFDIPVTIEAPTF